MRVGLIWIAILVALGGGGAIGAAGLGYRFDIWDLGTAFSILRSPAVHLAAAGGAVASMIGAVVALMAGPRLLAVPALLAAAVGGLGVYAPLQMKSLAEANPFIHDVTTDFDEPPAIIAAAELERRNPPEYLGDKSVRDGDRPTAELQREAFPDIQPALYEAAPAIVYNAALDVARSFGWEVLASDVEAGTIEAAATSFWFGFVDDVIIRVRATPTGTRVDVRSKSRVGGSDLGANAARVRAYLDRLDAEMVGR